MKAVLYIRNLKHRWELFIIRHLRRTGIFRRLSTSFLLLLLFSSLFLTVFSFFQYSAEINLYLERHASLLVQNTEMKIRDIMQEYEDTAVRFYDDPLVIAALTENASLGADGGTDHEQYESNAALIESALYRLRSNRKHIVNIQFVSPDRQYHMTEPNGYQRGGTIRDLDSFYESVFYQLPQEKKGYPVWIDGEEQSSVFYKTGQNFYGIGNTITMAAAVYEPSGRSFLGVLVFNIDYNAFSDAIRGYEAYNDGNIFLVGKDGVLTWFSPSLSAPSYPKDPELFSQMLREEQAILHTKFSGRPVLLAYEQIPNTQIFVSYIADMETLLERSVRVRDLCILVLICTVIIVFLLSYYVTISISDPVSRLVQVMDKAADGEWEVRYESSGHDEITLLGDRFNEMADKTNLLIKEVYQSEIRRQRAQLSWKNAQLDMLLMQINPHFLYNTLDIIRWEAMYEADGESPVTQMIEKFSRLCRLGMRTNGSTIRLSEGLEHASTYMDVINFRHSDKIALEIESEVDTDRVYIPQFMLQPIMENAVVHAFGDASRGCCIRIHARSAGAGLLIQVSDNGRGMDENELEKIRRALLADEIRDESIGLVNVNQRIRLFYGETYGIRIFSEAGHGTRLEILLPMREQPENMQELQKYQE